LYISPPPASITHNYNCTYFLSALFGSLHEELHMELLYIETSTDDITIRIASASKVESLTTLNMAILSIRRQWTSLLCLLIASLHIQSAFALDIAYCSTQNTGGGASPGKLYLPLPI
jgi:hypothetical protein